MSPRSREPSSAGAEPELVVDRVSVEQIGPADASGRSVIDVSDAAASTAAGFSTGTSRDDQVQAGIDISWTEDGACLVELRGRLTRPMLAKARDLLWSRSPQDRLTIVVSEAVLTRELFAMLIAGRRRLSSSGVLEIVGLDAPGARRIADGWRPTSR